MDAGRRPTARSSNHDPFALDLAPEVGAPSPHFFWTTWILFALSTIGISRWLLISSPWSYLDGDESLLGLMAAHFMEGRDVTIFPYGASFGVSIVETLTTASVASLFGLSEGSMQVSMLLLWLVGMAFAVRSLYTIGGRAAAACGIILFSTAPGWSHPSLASWGYYQTAFLSACAALALVTRLLRRPHAPSVITVGRLSLACSLAYYAQPIFAIGLIPFLVHLVLARRRPLDVIVLAVGFGLCTLTYMGFRGPSDYYWNPDLIGNTQILATLADLPSWLWVSAHGSFFLGQELTTGWLTRSFASLWCLAFVTAAGAAIRSAIRRRAWSPSLTALTGFLLILAFNLMVDPRAHGYRYLLAGLLMQTMMISIEVGAAWRYDPRRFWIAGLTLALLGLLVCSFETRHVSFSGSAVVTTLPEEQGLVQLIESLESQDIHHVYSLGAMLQWKIMFKSRDAITARWRPRTDRYAPYPLEVDEAFRDGRPVALVGEFTHPDVMTRRLMRGGLLDETPTLVGGRYLVINRPSRRLLESLQFQLNE